MEGLILFIIIAIAVWGFRALKRPGLVTGIFLIGYAIGRSVAERFRMPDSFVEGLPDWLTMGTVLSIPMVLLGIFLIWRGLKSGEQTAQASPEAG